ncbi:MAG: TolC family protein [Prolixibacteraceae bacterium]|jgi:outer membrane protein TolC|nr:TolC family protein [Prolixibacteraceae bacterium]
MSKFILLISIVALTSVSGFAQNTFTLENCREMVISNFPKLSNKQTNEEISQLKIENIRTGNLPEVVLNGRATYQSDVTSVNLPESLTSMGFDIEGVSNDQYNAYLDIRQTIWDGGVSKAQREIERLALENELQKIDVEVHQLKRIADTYFFNVVLLRKSIEVVKLQNEVLGKQLERVQAAFHEGAVTKKDVLKLEVEQLKMQQKITQTSMREKSLLIAMSVLAGVEFSVSDTFRMPDVSIVSEHENNRPELHLFSLQQKQLEMSNGLLQSARNPKFFGFGQAGYGKPGLNMLHNEFDTYYKVGVGLKWKVFDWNETKRKKQIAQLNGKMVDVQKENFLQKQDMELLKAQNEIEMQEQLVRQDENIVDMRHRITQTASSELENGSITPTDYLTDLNAETSAKVNYEIHKIELIKAKMNYKTLLGN